MSEETTRGQGPRPLAFEEIEALVDAHGGDPRHWPAAARAALESMELEPAVEALLAGARQLDELLARERSLLSEAAAAQADEAPPADLRARLLADHARVAARRQSAAEPARALRDEPARPWMAAAAAVAAEIRSHLGVLGAGMVGAAAAAGLAVGVVGPSASGEQTAVAETRALIEIAASFGAEDGLDGLSTNELSFEDEWGVLLMDAEDG